MTSKRLFFLLIACLCLLVVAIGGGTYEINGALEKQSGKLVSLKAKQQSLQQEQAQLIQMKKDIVTYNNLYKISQLIVPQSKDQTETVRQIISLAQKNDVTIASITFPASSIGTGISPLSLKTSAVAPTTSTPSSAGLSTNPALSQLAPITNIPGVYDLDIEVSSSNNSNSETTYPHMIGFLSALEQNRLTAQVSSISITPNPTSPGALSFTLDLDSFIKPESTK